LDVTFVERTPRYPRNLQCKAGDPLVDYPCPSPQKQFPDPGETVAFTAHILNKGSTPVNQFDYAWQIDGVSVKQGTHTWQSGPEQSEVLQWQWRAGPHKVRFLTNFAGDSFAANNSREIRTDAYALSIFVEVGQYEALDQRVNLTGSRSFEDWIQAQFDKFNDTFAAAYYPITPGGILARVRVDKIVVGPEMDGLTPNAFRLDPDEFLNDGRWLFSDGDPTNAQGYGGRYASYADYAVDTVDWALIHELAHQLGRFDMYNIDFAPEHNLITGPNGQPLLVGHAASNSQDIMESPGAGGWSEYHAASFNRDHGDRAGMYGAYLLDLPADNWLRIVDASSRPVSGARLSVYHDENEVLNDASLVFSGLTDSGGNFHLGANPFGQLNVVGTNATLFISVTVGSQSEYHWLEATAANMAFWRGHQDRAAYTLTLGAPDNKDWTLPALRPADTTPPEVSLVQPRGGDQLSGLTTFAAQVSDDRDVKRMEIMVDGRPIWVFERPPYEVAWGTAQLSNGTHSVWARVYDYALPAHVTDAPSVTVTVQNAMRHVFSWDFERDNDWEAWRVGWDPQWAASSVQDGVVHVPAMTFDPSMSRLLPFIFNLTAQQVVGVCMRVNGGGPGVGQFYWTTDADPFEDERKVIYFQIQGDNTWHEYTIQIGQHLLWNGRIRSIRLDPVHGDQYVGRIIDVDWIRVMDQSQTTTPTPTATPTPSQTPTLPSTATATQTPSQTPTLLSTATATRTPAQTTTPTETTTPASGSRHLFLPLIIRVPNLIAARQISVDAKVEWVDTGLEVLAGNEIRISYLNGSWSIWGGVDPYTDANGQLNRRDECTLLPSANTGGLVARIGTGIPQFIGNSSTLAALTSERLLLSMNDCPGHFGDNSGNLTVQITFVRPSSAGQNGYSQTNLSPESIFHFGLTPAIQ
jgi:hypothetical protein